MSSISSQRSEGCAKTRGQLIKKISFATSAKSLGIKQPNASQITLGILTIRGLLANIARSMGMTNPIVGLRTRKRNPLLVPRE
jgi:hypothetical protein